MKTEVKKEEGIVVNAALLAKYPVQSPSQLAEMGRAKAEMVARRQAAIEADKATVMSMKERLAVNKFRAETQPDTSTQVLEASISEHDKKIAEDEAKLAEDSK